jgi:iron only hydrogenase large subunit-like protein
MMGAIVKTYFAGREGLDPKKIVSVSIMPCTAKKFEAARPEMGRDSAQDVDFVLTTRELAELFRITGVDPSTLQAEAADTPFGERSSAGKLFGATGGVMEAAVRSVHFLLTGRELEDPTIAAARGLDGSKELHVRVGDLEVGAVVVSSLGQARKLLEEIKAGGRKDIRFIEVMTCPGGCINGGGQPIGAAKDAVMARMKALYTIDRNAPLRLSHRNASVQRLYDEFLGKPLGEKSHHLLHTHYQERDVMA